MSVKKRMGIIILSVTMAFIVMSGGYGIWEKNITIDGIVISDETTPLFMLLALGGGEAETTKPEGEETIITDKGQQTTDETLARDDSMVIDIGIDSTEQSNNAGDIDTDVQLSPISSGPEVESETVPLSNPTEGNNIEETDDESVNGVQLSAGEPNESQRESGIEREDNSAALGDSTADNNSVETTVQSDDNDTQLDSTQSNDSQGASSTEVNNTSESSDDQSAEN
ncbi:hypothetical protein [Anaerosolibacter sp.]|uniref:hypothetical protein n=1 Tax=Anaerosolibacter sp. TaxID=1872527 RepID=UPI0039F128A3